MAGGHGNTGGWRSVEAVHGLGLHLTLDRWFDSAWDVSRALAVGRCKNIHTTVVILSVGIISIVLWLLLAIACACEVADPGLAEVDGQPVSVVVR